MDILSFLSRFLVLSFCDAPETWQTSTQDPATPIMEGMIIFHNYLMFYVIFIGFAVCWLLYIIIKDFNSSVNKNPMKFNHHSILEIVWTVLPALVLVLIAVPSFSLLYSLDDLVDPSITVKIVGHQWYWSYEISDHNLLDYSHKNFVLKASPDEVWERPTHLNFDSYIVEDSSLLEGQLRLLEVDNALWLPINTHIRLLVTSADVLHSWAVPSFGIKVDACPGRLSQASLFIKRKGFFYGQCSEICGVNHGFMPITVRGVSQSYFLKYIHSRLHLSI